MITQYEEHSFVSFEKARKPSASKYIILYLSAILCREGHNQRLKPAPRSHLAPKADHNIFDLVAAETLLPVDVEAKPLEPQQLVVPSNPTARPAGVGRATTVSGIATAARANVIAVALGLRLGGVFVVRSKPCGAAGGSLGLRFVRRGYRRPALEYGLVEAD